MIIIFVDITIILALPLLVDNYRIILIMMMENYSFFENIHQIVEYARLFYNDIFNFIVYH